ncbi:MAG: phosphatase PAP2 family protein [Prevotellaceae bacterium]|jgi:undecaprenyl-diphosphatase|nr:phosphatase PAP2 family protein [Prevotellaceae bacterium]
MSGIEFPRADTDLFLLLNGLHADWLDPAMRTFSSITFWIPMYLIVAAAIIKKRRAESIAVLGALLLAFAMCDFLSVHLFKNVFERLRPCHNEEIQASVRLLENCGGRYGFVSNHAANAFCFATFTFPIFRNKYYTAAILLWAACVAYSRIYVGKHFPLDVVCGAMFGVLCRQTAMIALRKLRIKN